MKCIFYNKSSRTNFLKKKISISALTPFFFLCSVFLLLLFNASGMQIVMIGCKKQKGDKTNVNAVK